jgi:hypothetical protein
MGKKFGFSWSWRRASGYSAAKGRLSRAIGIPLTRGGRQRKVGALMGCCIPIAILVGSVAAAWVATPHVTGGAPSSRVSRAISLPQVR